MLCTPHFLQCTIKLILSCYDYRLFDTPNPPDDIIAHTVGNFTLAIDRSLRAGTTKSTQVSIEFRHDVFKYFFNNKTSLSAEDFPSKWFVDGWDQCYFERRGHNEQHKHYNGYRVLYPVTVNSKHLAWSRTKFCKNSSSNIVSKRQVFVEIVSFSIRKVSCNTIFL